MDPVLLPPHDTHVVYRASRTENYGCSDDMEYHDDVEPRSGPSVVLCDLPWESLVVMCSYLNGSSEEMLRSLMNNIDALSNQQTLLPNVSNASNEVNLLSLRLCTTCLPFAMRWNIIAGQEVDRVLRHIEDIESKKSEVIELCILEASKIQNVFRKNLNYARGKLNDANFEQFRAFSTPLLDVYQKRLKQQFRSNLQMINRIAYVRDPEQLRNEFEHPKLEMHTSVNKILCGASPESAEEACLHCHHLLRKQIGIKLVELKIKVKDLQDRLKIVTKTEDPKS